jgi:molybdenum storage protein
MSEKRNGRIWIEGLDTVFSGQSISNLALSDQLPSSSPVRILPDVWVVKIGGQSIMDRGRSAVFPIIDELVEAKNSGVQFILCVGGGTRARHVYALGLDLGMPTGALAKVGASIPVQNARMLQMLTAKHGGVMVYHEDLEKLPLYLATKCLPIMSGMPPFEFWEKTPGKGRLPSHRTDAGTYLLGEFLGAKGVLYIKDEDGLFTADPKKDPQARLLDRANARELLESDQDDFIVERVVLKYMQRAAHVRQIRIVNGLRTGRVSAALRGETVGSVIVADQ